MTYICTCLAQDQLQKAFIIEEKSTQGRSEESTVAAGVEETGAAGTTGAVGTTGAAGIGTVAAATLDVFCGWAPKPAGAEELGPIIGPRGRDTGGNCCVRGGACWACCRGCC